MSAPNPFGYAAEEWRRRRDAHGASPMRVPELRAALEFAERMHDLQRPPHLVRIRALEAMLDREREKARAADYARQTAEIEKAEEVGTLQRRLTRSERENQRLLAIVERLSRGEPAEPAPVVTPVEQAPAPKRKGRLSPAARAILSKPPPDPAAYDVDRDLARESSDAP